MGPFSVLALDGRRHSGVCGSSASVRSRGLAAVPNAWPGQPPFLAAGAPINGVASACGQRAIASAALPMAGRLVVFSDDGASPRAREGVFLPFLSRPGLFNGVTSDV
jgi:hypothetical protein